MNDERSEPPLRRIEEALRGIMRTTTTRRAHGRWTKEAGLDIAHVPFRILSAVCVSGPVRSSQLAEMLDLEPPLVSREVSRLEKNGLITRTSDGTDGRAQLVKPTPAGRKIYRKYRATLEKRIDAAVSDWTEAELEQLARLLERFAADVKRPDQR